MNARRLTGAASAAMAMATASALCACGGVASTASPGTIAPAAAISAAASNPVTVSPLPGTVDASSATQISFLGRAGTQVSDVRVVGSASGTHSGRIQGYSTGTGASFLPSHPFRAGERVTVHATVATAAGGPAPGGEHDVHDRSPGRLQPGAVPEQPAAIPAPCSTTARRRR